MSGNRRVRDSIIRYRVHHVHLRPPQDPTEGLQVLLVDPQPLRAALHTLPDTRPSQNNRGE